MNLAVQISTASFQPEHFVFFKKHPTMLMGHFTVLNRMDNPGFEKHFQITFCHVRETVANPTLLRKYFGLKKTACESFFTFLISGPSPSRVQTAIIQTLQFLALLIWPETTRQFPGKMTRLKETGGLKTSTQVEYDVGCN